MPHAKFHNPRTTTCGIIWVGVLDVLLVLSPESKVKYGHRSEVKRKEDGVGAHFFHHAEELGINLDTNMEDIMQYFNITIIASVEPDMPWSRDRLDTLFTIW